MSLNIWKRLSRSRSPQRPEAKYGLYVLFDPLKPSDDFARGTAAGNRQDPDASTVDVDIVAVHGLGGHAINTWTHKDTNKMWLRDFLPTAMKNARIMTFGYDATIYNGGSTLGIMENAENLLHEVSQVRRVAEEKPRRLIFIGHSLGGLVVKKALIMAQQESRYNNVLRSVCGVMFMGVPHGGSDLAVFATRLTTIANVVTRLNTTNLRDLERDSRPLQDISKAFGNLEGFNIATVTEADETRIPGTSKRVLVVPTSSARLNLGKREVVFGILGSDHHTVCKFRSSGDTQYLKVCNTLKTMAEEGLESRLASVTVTPAEFRSVVEGPYYEIPSLQVSQYVDRVELLREIESNFANTLGSASDRRIVVLLGMGGQGKTQLALEYCRMVKALGTYKGIFWIDASSPNTVSRGFETIMEKISGRGQAIDDIESKVAFVKDTLESWEEPWIMVFDNYDRPGEFKDISSYFPQGRTGMLLFTSRHADSERLGVAIKITQMTIEEGLELLLRRSKLQRNSGNTVEGKKIIQKLAYLPLAIDQAGAYIAARVIPLQLFVKHYDERKEVVLKHTPLLWEYRRRLDEGKDETLLSVFTTWELSFQQVGKYEEERIMICRFLTLSAFFDATNISEHLFISHLALIRKPPQWMEQFISEGVWDQFKYQDILVELRGLSLLQDLNIGSEETSFSLHPLVIDWLKLRIDQKSRREYIIEATMVLGNYIGKQNVEALPLQVRLDMVSHVDIYLQNRREYLRELDESDMASLWRHIFYFANLYLYHGRYQEAEVMYQQSLIGCVRAVGPDHESTLDTVQNLGILYRDQSRFAEAETMYERALTGYEKSLGLDHESTLNTIICLGLVYINQDRLTEAEATLGRALTRCERALGLDHLSTLGAVHSLGIVYNKQRRVAEAQAMFERAFTGCEKSLGSDHESTLNTVQSLGILYDEQGKFAEAETMYERALTGYEKSLGPHHKWTLNTIICLGLFYINQDRLTEAEATLGRALTGCERTLGLNNLSTLDTIHNLGILYRKQNRVVEAEAAFDRALMGYDKLLGPDHGSTLEMVMGLVGLYKNQGKLAKVEALYQRHQSWAATQADSRSL